MKKIKDWLRREFLRPWGWSDWAAAVVGTTLGLAFGALWIR